MKARVERAKRLVSLLSLGFVALALAAVPAQGRVTPSVAAVMPPPTIKYL
jgi:hypothetical protein